MSSTNALDSKSLDSVSLSFSRTKSNTIVGGNDATFSLSKSSSVTVTMADNVDLSDTGKAILAAQTLLSDLASGKVPDSSQDQTETYNVLGVKTNQSTTISGPHSSDVATSATTEYSVTDGTSSFTVSLTDSTEVESSSRLLLLGMNSNSDDTVTVSTGNESMIAATSTAAAVKTGDATGKSGDPATAALALLKQNSQAADDRSNAGNPDKMDFLNLAVLDSDAG